MSAADRSGTRREALTNGRRLLGIDPDAALSQARELLHHDAGDPDALRLLGAAFRRLGEIAEAEAAERKAIQAASRNPLLVDAANKIAARKLAEAERLLRPYIIDTPDDAAAHLMLARIAADVGADDEARRLLRYTLDLAPAYGEAWLLLARVLADGGTLEAALDTLGQAPGEFRGRPPSLRLEAQLLSRLGDYEDAAAAHQRLLEAEPRSVTSWIAYGHLLRTIGRKAEAIEAYRRAVAIDPHCGPAWWSLTNLKTEPVSDADVAAMERVVHEATRKDDLFHLHFALGKAKEDRGDYRPAFAHYSEANRLRRLTLPYDRTETDQIVTKAHADLASAIPSRVTSTRPDAIFIIGMPRSGSTLLEQILASHSKIEGTSELPYIRTLALRAGKAPLSANQHRALGKEYLQLAGRHRKTARPIFIDKQPNNWMHVGFIRRILPNARIIDIRRHPLASCIANFRQHFGQGQEFSYSLSDIAHVYASYAGLIDAWRTLHPGSIHRLLYEDLIREPEHEVRALLGHLGLPYESACLLFHENGRAVRTPSSEQVRQPIYESALQDWRGFEPWLASARNMLEREIAAYPWSPDDAPA